MTATITTLVPVAQALNADDIYPIRDNVQLALRVADAAFSGRLTLQNGNL